MHLRYLFYFLLKQMKQFYNSHQNILFSVANETILRVSYYDVRNP